MEQEMSRLQEMLCISVIDIFHQRTTFTFDPVHMQVLLQSGVDSRSRVVSWTSNYSKRAKFLECTTFEFDLCDAAEARVLKIAACNDVQAHKLEAFLTTFTENRT